MKRLLGLVSLLTLLVFMAVTYLPVIVDASSSRVSLSLGLPGFSERNVVSRYVVNSDGTYTWSNIWLISYETLLFDTSSGDLGLKEYALDGRETGYYIRTRSSEEAQFEWVDLTYRITGLKRVDIIVGGHAYYDHFLTSSGAVNLASSPMTAIMDLPAGSIVRCRSSVLLYDSLRYTKEAPQPMRTEVVSALPPPIPSISVLGGSSVVEHHSIGYDATSNTGTLGTVSSYAFNHTCGASADLLVFGDSHLSASGQDQTVTAVTYNTVAMTYVRSDANGRHRSSIFFLYAPGTGSALSVAVTYSGTITSGTGGVVSYSGAAQSGQPDAHNGTTGASSAPSVDVTTVANNCWVFSAVKSNGVVTSTNTGRWASSTRGGSDTGAPKTPAGTQTMGWTTPAYNPWAISAASFAPAAGYSLTNSPSTYAFGVVNTSSFYYAKGSAPANPVVDGNCTFLITNNGGSTENISIKTTNATGGVGWTKTSGVPGADQFNQTAYCTGQDPSTGPVLTAAYQILKSNLAASGTVMWDLRLATGSSFTDGVLKTWTVTLQASSP